MKVNRPVLLAFLSVILVLLVGLRVWQELAPLHPQLVSVEDNARNMALSRLARLDPEKKQALVPLLVDDLQNPDARVRRYALYALRKINMPDDDVLHAASMAISDGEEAVRQEAVVAIMEFGSSASAPVLIKLLGDEDKPAVQHAALDLIVRWKEAVGPTMPGLLQALDAPDASVRRETALLLIAFSTQTERAVTALLPFIKEPMDSKIIEALGSAGPAARAAVPSLVQLMNKSADSFIKENAPRPVIARALNKIDPRKSDIASLSWDLKNKDAIVRYRAAFTLSERNDLGAGAVPVLVRSLDDKDDYVIGRIVRALTSVGIENLGPLTGTAVPKLVAALRRVSENKVEGFGAHLEPELQKLRVLSPKE